MGKFEEYFDICEEYFVNESLTLTRIQALTGVSQMTLNKWKEMGNWEKKRCESLKRQQSFKAKIQKLKLKLLDIALASGDPQRVYAFAAAFKLDSKNGEGETVSPGAIDEATKDKGLPPELVEEIRNKILGIT